MPSRFQSAIVVLALIATAFISPIAPAQDATDKPTFAPSKTGQANLIDEPVVGGPFTGPHKVVIELDPTIETHTVYRPDPLGDGPHPVLVWGEGACANDGLMFPEFLREVASHGFVVIADGPPDHSYTRNRAARPSPPAGQSATPARARPSAGAIDRMVNNGADLVTAMDWAQAQNTNPESKYFGKLETTRMAAMGMSCGGLMAYAASADPRVATVGIWNSGLFTRDADIYAGLHGPVIIVTGGETDIAYENGKADFEAIDREDIPMVYGSYPAVGHFGTYSQDNGGPFGKVAIAWLRWTLMGDEGTSGKGLFAGENSPLAQDADWVIRTKHLDK